MTGTLCKSLSVFADTLSAARGVSFAPAMSALAKATAPHAIYDTLEVVICPAAR